MQSFKHSYKKTHKKWLPTYVETETSIRVTSFNLTHLDRQIGWASITDENQPRCLFTVGAVGHPAFLRHDLNVRHWNANQRRDGVET